METVDMINVKVKAANQPRDAIISLRSDDSVGTFKRKVTADLNYTGKNVRLISSGKLLDPDSACISKFGITEGSYVHVVVSDLKSTPSHQSSTSQSNPIAAAPTLPVNPRGFDRLVCSSFSMDEAAALRSSFTSQVDEYSAQNPPRQSNTLPAAENGGHDSDGSDNDSDGNASDGNVPLLSRRSRDGSGSSHSGSGVLPEDPVSYRYRMEEEWMALQGPASEFYMNLPVTMASALATGTPLNSLSSTTQFPMSMAALYQMRRAALAAQLSAGSDSPLLTPGSSNGTTGGSRDFLWGFLLGFTLGFLMLFCVWDRNVSQKQKLGIMCGVSAHMLSAYFQQQSAHTAASAAVVAGGSGSSVVYNSPPSGGGGGGGGVVGGGLEGVDIVVD
jgi:hypothetical protein